MPYPKNYEVAKALENIVRQNGAIPATCAIINGFPKVGLLDSELKLLSNPEGIPNLVIKASTRDIAYACANRLHAGKTLTISSVFIIFNVT
jgi:pseudouridine-5'-phosphate glycosidase